MELPKKLKALVDPIINLKNDIDIKKANLEFMQNDVISYVLSKQIEMARSGTFFKTCKVNGEIGALTYTSANKFIIPQDTDTLKKIKELVGQDNYQEFFEVKRTIKLKEEIHNNKPLINKFLAVVKEFNLEPNKVFDVSTEVIAANDLDRKQFMLNDGQLKEFQILVKQRKQGLNREKLKLEKS